MYLKFIHIQNTGPIKDFKFEFPFDGENPKPVVLVGPNGSGKSTALSFLVSALVGCRQEVFQNAEIEKGMAYRLRSSLAIHGDANFSYTELLFKNGLSWHEWQLDRSKEEFIAQVKAPPDCQRWWGMSGWKDMGMHEMSQLSLGGRARLPSRELKKKLDGNCLLFFPADRFELPDWLNEQNLSAELSFPEPSRNKSKTDRKLIARNRLKPILEWLTAVLLDLLLEKNPTVGSRKVFDAALLPLSEILAEGSGPVDITFGGRSSRIISATIKRDGQVVKTIRDLLSLSAGESALFCMFASIIRDADLAGMKFSSPADIRGLVVIDEADLHLHLNLQYKVLPKLIQMFPKVQFIITAHSPLFVLGMQKEFGNDGFQTLEMPTGRPIDAECYSEFLDAYQVLADTKKFQDDLQAQSTQPKPIVITEGKTDALLLQTAWEKLNPGVDVPFMVIPCGEDTGKSSGAENLNRALNFFPSGFPKRAVVLFDNDREGARHFSGLSAPQFTHGIDKSHAVHASKNIGAVLLPTPIGREEFVHDQIPHRVLEIEHYFDDGVLESNGVKGDSIFKGASVFEILGSKAKVAFAEKAKDFPVEAFTNFRDLFTRLDAALKYIAAPAPSANPTATSTPAI